MTVIGPLPAVTHLQTFLQTLTNDHSERALLVEEGGGGDNSHKSVCADIKDSKIIILLT